MPLSRRSLLAAGVSAPFVATGLSAPARAGGHAAPANARKRSFSIGEFEVSTLLVGSRVMEDPQSLFAVNVDAEEFARVSEENFIPSDRAQGFITPTVVNTGSEVVLFDTGIEPTGTVAVLAEAGLAPEDVTIVVLTHMHPDHIGGLLTDGAETFPNARYVTGQVEFDAWAAAGNEMFDTVVRPLAEKMTFIGDGGSVVSGITGMAAFGHTPGHMVFMLDSGGEQLLLLADLANHHVWSLAYPEWQFRFDSDPEAATAARREVLGMAAADRLPVAGYHMPFPATGFVETREDGFRWIPTSYQLML